MKKLGLQILGITFTLLLFASCNATKKGCGLTSDATKIEQSITIEKVSTAKV